MIWFLQKKITDGTLDGDPPGSSDGTFLRLGTSERIKEGTKGGVLNWYLDGILLGAELYTRDGYILRSDDGTSEGTKNSTKDDVIDEYLDGILDGIPVILRAVMSTVWLDIAEHNDDGTINRGFDGDNGVSSRDNNCIAMSRWRNCDGAMVILIAVVVAMNEVVIFTEYLLWGQCLFHSRTLIGKVLY